MRYSLRYSLLSCLSLLALAGCSGGDSTQPTASFRGSPSFVIADGAHGGNVDFFFLPPMVANPRGKPGYEANAFNPNLKPTVTICALDAANETAAASASCKNTSGAYVRSVTVLADDEQYQYNWEVPTSRDVFYRITVRVGTILLGSADVETSESPHELKNVDESKFVAVKNGRTLPVKFRIERYALCATPGVGPCATQTVNFATGGEVTTPLGGGQAGVTIPAQPNTAVSTITVEGCDPLNPRATDLPVFGPCVRVTANPALSASALVNSATVFICGVTATLPPTMSSSQRERVTLHRFDAPSALAALPHAHACEPSFAAGSIKGLFRDLAHGAFKAAGGQLVSLLLPKALNAASRRLDVGAGGSTIDFSDFQFALPAKLQISAGDGQVAAPGSTLPVNPKVLVTDLGGDPVPGARVRFAATATTCAGLSAGVGTPSDASGAVSSTWTISGIAGANQLFACGRGLAGSDVHGPRPGVDPFQPLSTHFGDLSNGGFVPVLTGSVQFTATGITLPATLLAFGSGGYSSYGPFNAGDPQPSGWPNPAPATSATVGSLSPFFGNYSGCSITVSGPSAATFPENKDIFVTKSVSVPVAGMMEITVRIDNDLRIWVDGVEKTALVPASVTGVYVSATGFWTHDGCADVGPAVYSLSVAAGTHTISLLGHDRGAVGYLDMKIVLNNP